ncbi:MAG: CDP-diacylglycerol--serine O-phosphatidyltransferase [Bacteroidota bacterium]|jgi:CDP-diacylglycerol--serine O-phosphatidyltransferase|nr:CDP-diacylglycerol--serine O-phosphatidyltransferase [Bacteroidota bacterium]
MVKQIPNLFTLLNLVFGCMACVAALQPGIIMAADNNGQLYYDVPEQIWLASLFIMAGAIVDYFDGLLARLLKASSAMGRELDSLSDVVSFGVAPSLILYQFLRLSWAQEEQGLDQSVLLLWPAFLLPVAAAWRLARFNLNQATSSSSYFKGLPVPAAGLFVASLPLVYWEVNQAWVPALLLNAVFLYSVILVLAALMISQLPILAFKFNSFAWKENKLRYGILLLSIVLLLFLQWLAIPLIILIYVLLSLFFKKLFA